VTPDRLEHLRACAYHAIGDLVFLPGAEREDLRQEAMVGLVEALRDYRPGTGLKLEGFVALCARRKALTAIRLQNLPKRLILTHAGRVDVDDEGVAVPLVDLVASPADTVGQALARIELAEIGTLVAHSMSTIEQRAVVGAALGLTYAEIGGGRHDAKSVDNAYRRGREKLRSAA
jgi:RNA polymerase sporulation-specific sigma factor